MARGSLPKAAAGSPDGSFRFVELFAGIGGFRWALEAWEFNHEKWGHPGVFIGDTWAYTQR